MQALSVTPPNSPPEPVEQINQRRETMRHRGRKSVRKDRAKAYRKINSLQVCLFRQKRLIDKWKKRCERLKRNSETKLEQKVNSIIKKGEEKKALLVHQAIVSRVQQRYLSSKSDKDKQLISSLIYAFKSLKRHRICSYAKKIMGFSGRSRLSIKPKEPRNKKLVADFLSRDDNSRLKADKKATISRKGEKRQIRLLSYDLKKLHAKFLTETNTKISYSLFCSFKPFNIIRPTAKDRDTCLCRTCKNFEMKVERCHHEKALKSKDVYKVLESAVCNTNNKSCMYRECENCKDRTIIFEPDVDMGKQVSWFEWKTKRVEKEKKVQGKDVSSVVNVTCKEKDGGSLQVLCDELNMAVSKISKHVFNIHHQYLAIRNLKETLTESEIIIHMDFSENFNRKYSNEVQSMHFGSSQRQISLHTSVVYTTESTLSFCTVSDCLDHSPSAIWAHLDPVLKIMKTDTNAKTVHFVSDGPTTQYRNKQNFYLLSKKIFEYGFEFSTWNFLEAGHGKGAADGIGAVAKRTADGFIHRSGDITGAKDLQMVLEEAGSKVKVLIIDEEAVQNIAEELPLSLKPLPRTMQIHQVLVTNLGTLRHRPLSCFCKKPDVCDCFNPVSAMFSVQIGHEPETEPETANVQHKNNSKLKPVEEVDETLVSQYCVVKYDGRAYPGVVLSVDDNELEVKTMHRVGRNRFFWPQIDDTLWYTRNAVLTILDAPPKAVTSRHVQVDPEIWLEIEKEEA